MISISKRSTRTSSTPASNHRFLAMLPTIRRCANMAFRGVHSELREELVAEVVANTFVAFSRLVEQGKVELAYATPLALFGIKQVRVGRKVGGRLNVRDLASHYCRRRNGVSLNRLDRYDREEQGWQEVLVEDRHAGPADVAASRIDFADWLRSLPRRHRRIATTLASGESTSAVARKFRVTAGRISQLRREFQQRWLSFVGERPEPTTA